MEPNKFERQVQQKLEEFKIPPAEQVWTKIEKDIGSKKKDRWILLLIAFLFLVTISGFWVFHHHKNISEPENKQLAKNFIPPADSAAATQELAQTSENAAGEKNKKLEQNPAAEKSLKETIAVSKKEEINSLSKNYFKSPKNKNHNSGNNNFDFQRQNDLIIVPEHLNIAWSIKNENINLENPDTVNSVAALIFSGIRKGQITHPWKFGITVSAGNSWTMKGPSSSFNPVLSGPPSSYGQGAFYNAFYYPSPKPFKRSFSFSAGIFAEKKISKGTDLNVGLSFDQFSLQNNVRNNFEFIELPVQFEFQLNRNPHLPMTFDAGITAGYLIGSDAMQYNDSRNSWYIDNDLFNKLQVNLQTGFSISLFNQYKHPLRFGPNFSYGLMQMSNTGLYSAKHVSVLGIHAQMFVGK